MSEDQERSRQADSDRDDAARRRGVDESASTKEPPAASEPPDALHERATPSLNLDPETRAKVAVAYFEEQVRLAVRSEAKWLLLWGAISIILGGFSQTSVSFGILLVIVGGLAWLIADGVLFVASGVLMAWAGLSNILSGNTTWLILALFQFFWSYREFQRFFAVRKAEDALLAGLPPDYLVEHKGVARWFPLAGMILGILSIGALVVSFLGLAIYFSNPGTDNVTRLMGELVGLARSVMILGLSVSLGSLLDRFRYRFMSIIGLVTSVLSLVGWLWFMF